YIRDDELLVKMIVLLIVMIVFYFLGSLWKWALDYFEKQNAPKEEAVSEEESTLDEAKEESVSSNKSF
ncbi:MAG: hypothetical protein LBM69_06845, partial [Lachnospiraceae bacterium]|nr:hypothetical protein [Lachnospiraceae bacterium]